MIKVEAEILRGSCTPVFFVGETIECEIKFKHVKAKEKTKPKSTKRSLTLPDFQNHQQIETKHDSSIKFDADFRESQNDIDESMFSIFSSPNFRTNECVSPLMVDSIDAQNETDSQQIAWACAQIDCHCFIDESKVVLPKDPLRYNTHENRTNEMQNTFNSNNNSNNSVATSFQPNKDRIGISVFSSKPKILFCNLSLGKNQTKKFIFKETLPYDLAPTFRGQFARYTYKLTIGVQKLHRSTLLLRLPFKVYSLYDLEKYVLKNEMKSMVKRDSLYSIEESSQNPPSQGKEDENDTNPFKFEEKQEYDNLEFALQVLDDLTSSNVINNFNVTNKNGKIGKISLNKSNFKIGDKIIGFMDFSDSQVSCVEFKVTLQSEEIIAEECRKKANQTLSCISSHVEIKENCLYLKKSDFTIQIPSHITPTFVSDIISLRWRLHFDFALSKTSIQKIQKSHDSSMSVSWRPTNSLTLEVLSWDLPIFIHPFDPFVASDLLHLNQTLDNNSLILK